MPAIHAVINEAIAPPIIAFKTSSEISFFRSGAIPQYPPTEYQWSQN